MRGEMKMTEQFRPDFLLKIMQVPTSDMDPIYFSNPVAALTIADAHWHTLGVPRLH